MGSSHDHHPVEVDPHALENAHNLWNNFTIATKYGVIAAIVILVLMALLIA